MSTYTAVKGLGDTITCDDCNNIAEDWFSGESRAICRDCYSQVSISWSELAKLTHATQVERFNFCMCEDNEGQENPYADCPRECIQCFNMYSEPDNREDTCDFCQGNLRRR